MNTNKRTIKSGFKENQSLNELATQGMNTIGGSNTVFNQDYYEHLSTVIPYYDPCVNTVETGFVYPSKWFYDPSLSLNETIPWMTNFDSNFVQYMFSLFFCQCQNYESAIPQYVHSEYENTAVKINGADLLSTELITKLFRDHAHEMEKSKQQVLSEIESFRNNNDIVFHQKAKPIKESSEKGEKFRGSLYRGVSVNGKSWQVFIVINKCKCYAGCVESEEKAAAIYDRLAIIFHGLKAKTNFSYSKSDVLLCFEIASNANN